MTSKRWDDVSAVMTVEGIPGFQTNSAAVYISALQHLINSGAVSRLPGWVFRLANDAIRAGLCKLPQN